MKTLYGRKKYGFPIITVALFLTCTIVTIPTYFTKELWYVFATQSKPFYFWQLFSGAFEHSVFPISSLWQFFSDNPSLFLWVHFIGNMLVLFTCGLMIERFMGSGKFLLLTALGLFSHLLFFHINNYGKESFGSGASGIVYAYIPVAVYMVIRYVYMGRVDWKKDRFFHIFVANLIISWGIVTVISGWRETNFYHMIATIAGIAFLLIFYKQINREISSLSNERASDVPVPQKCAYYSLMILPLGALLLVTLYFCGSLDGMFIKPTSISANKTVREVALNGNKIEIVFSEPIEKYPSTYTHGSDPSEIVYSEDKKTVYVVFPNGIHHPHKIKLRSSRGSDGRIVKHLEFNIKE